MIKMLTRIMDRCRRFIINKLGGVPREDGLKYTIEHVNYPTIKLARAYECPQNEEIIGYTEKELAREFGLFLLETNLIQIERHHEHDDSVLLRADLEVVDKRDKSI